MYFNNDEIKRVVHAAHNYQLSFRYHNYDVVEEMRISELSNHVGYYVTAIIKANGYENECHMHIDESMHVKRFECDCPYCDEQMGCAHIGALMMKINQLNPQVFPFLYKSDDAAYDHTTLLTKAESDDYEKERKARREERIQRYREERRRLEEAERQMLQNAKLKMTNRLIETERENLLHTMSADRGGSVHLQLCYERSVTFTYTYGMYIQLKIGRKRNYIVKNVFTLMKDIQKKKWVQYGKELAFIHTVDAFDEDSQSILHFLDDYTRDEQENHLNCRELYIGGARLRKLYELCAGLSKEYGNIQTQEQTIRLSLKLHEHTDYMQLELCNMPNFIVGYLDESGLYQVKDNQLIRFCMDAQGKCARLIRCFIENQGEVLIAREDISSFAKYIWQDIRDYCEIEGNVALLNIDELDQLSLYGDMDEHGTLALRLEGRNEEHRICGFDDSLKEKPLTLEMVETYIKSFANVIDMDDHVAYLPADDDSTFSFLRDGLSFLREYCDIYISDAILKLGNDHHVNLSAGVRIAENLLEFTFSSNEIAQDELFDVLRSYRRKRKYHRLKSGQLISLDAPEIKAFDEMTELLHLPEKKLQEKEIKVPLYRAFTLEAMGQTDSGLTIQRSAAAAQLQEAIMQRKGGEFPLSPHYQSILRDYQLQGYQWLKLMNHYHFGAILADDMGLGKTLQVIALLESETGHGPSLVVTPSSLIYNWQDEIIKFGDQLKTLCIVGSASKRALAIQTIKDYDVAITSYDYLRRDIALYEHIAFHYAILDEAQYIKNQKTKNAHSVKELHAAHRLALTGTPIENSLAELWSLFDFLMPGYLYNYHYFANEYEKPIVKEQETKAREKLKRMVEPFILRRTKKEVLKELPEKIEQTMTIAFYEEEKKLYLANLMQVSKDLQKQLHGGELDRMQVLAMLTRLRQLCCEPRLVYDNVQRSSSKCNACVELCLSLRENHQRILLFSSFTTVLDLLEEELSRYHFRLLKLTGKNTKEERREMVRQFQEERADIFLISLKAGGTGLNLTAAGAVIHYDPWWNISAQNQATDRAYRIGQEQNVQVFSLIMKDSIEEKIRKLQLKKQNLADAFVENSDGSISAMSAQEIMALFE